MIAGSFDKISLQYDTGAIPPPFCHRYNISFINGEDGKYSSSLKLEYYDREEITEEEIYDEGFSMEDGFTWKGTLPDIWSEEIIKKIKSSSWKKKNKSGRESEFIIKVENSTQSETLQPADARQWEVFGQEIIQAVFEFSKKEAPLFISFVSKKTKEEIKQLDLEFSFANRSINITSQENRQKTMDWPEGQKLLKYIFGVDYYPEDGFENISKNPGNYISPGDGLWYELTSENKSSKDTSTKANMLAQTLSSLIE